jgi:hypothetical protein
MSHIKTLKISPTCFDHQLIIIRELFDPSYYHWLKYESSCVFMRQHTFIRFSCCTVWRSMSNSDINFHVLQQNVRYNFQVLQVHSGM